MGTATVIGAAVIGAIAVLWLYRLVFLISKKIERYRLRQQGRLIAWASALERVARGSGYFLIAKSRRHAELFYVDGEMPEDQVGLRRVWQDRSSLVEAHPGRATWTNLQALTAGKKHAKLDTDVLVV